MRWSHLQFNVRQMLIAVMLIAVVLATLPFRQRSATYHRMALEHARQVRVCQGNAKVQRAFGQRHPEIRVIMEASAEEFERCAAWHAVLAEKYRRAASRPWEGVSPDRLPPIGSVSLAERFPREAEALRRIERGRRTAQSQVSHQP